MYDYKCPHCGHALLKMDQEGLACPQCFKAVPKDLPKAPPKLPWLAAIMGFIVLLSGVSVASYVFVFSFPVVEPMNVQDAADLFRNKEAMYGIYGLMGICLGFVCIHYTVKNIQQGFKVGLWVLSVVLVLGIGGWSSLKAWQRHESSAWQRALISELNPVFVYDLNPGPAPVLNTHTKLLVWNVPADRPSEAMFDIPIARQASSNVEPMTVIAIIEVTQENKGQYVKGYNTKPIAVAVQRSLMVCVVNLPERTVLGTFTITGEDPPARVNSDSTSIDSGTLYTNTTRPLRDWILSRCRPSLP
ncbi:MAG: hypothetical protein KIS92_09130 [Planctomycetota bacterium]|nr:hypothetical protein [Planctomycetota bacterium]